MSERQLDHLLDLRQLSPTAADVVVADFVQRFLFLLRASRAILCTQIKCYYKAATSTRNKVSGTAER